MIELFKEAVLLVDLLEAGLEKGDVGVVVMIHGDHEGYEVEFMTKEGRTIAVETLMADQIRPINNLDILHVRDSLPPAQMIIILDKESMAEAPPTPVAVSPDAIMIELSDELLEQKGATREDFKLQLALFLFQQDLYSLGKASEFTGLHPIQFQKELANRQIPVHYDVTEYQQDANTLDNYMSSSHTTLLK